MKIAYRNLTIDIAIEDLEQVKNGIIDVDESIRREGYHLRPFVDSGISEDRLHEIREDMFKYLNFATQNVSDFPHGKKEYSDFDKLFTKNALNIFHDLSPIDGFNRDVWSYMTLRVLPDFALWRWGERMTDERFLGGAERSCFQRLWLRAYVIGPELASELFEDEAVNIFERPEALGGNRRLAIAFANHIVRNRNVKDLESGSLMISTGIVKLAAKALRRSMSVIVVQSMTDSELEAHISRIFSESFKLKTE
jgi:hypothetical protein